jgi:hypothetical protein
VKGLAQKLWEQASYNSPLGARVSFNTKVGSIAQGDWLKVFTVSGNMNGSIDWGDGTTTNWTATTTTTSIGLNKTYGTGYGAGVTKTITIIIPDRFNVKEIRITQGGGEDSPIPVELSRLTNLQKIVISNQQFNGIPAAILDLNNLNEVSLTNCFVAGSSLYSSFPDVVLYKEGLIPRSLITLGYTLRNTGNNSTTGFNRLKDLASTLTSLNISDDLGNSTDFPADILDLTNLETLNFDLAVSNSQLPTVLNSMTWLKRLILNRFSELQNLSNVQALVNLETLNLIQVINARLSTSLPTDLAVYTKLKNLSVFGSYGSAARADAFVDNFYSMVVANAPISGTSSDPFRSMAIDFRLNGTLTGTYQQPAGYVAGSSNGTPASPQEKRWVLVNQYAHVWTM